MAALDAGDGGLGDARGAGQRSLGEAGAAAGASQAGGDVHALDDTRSAIKVRGHAGLDVVSTYYDTEMAKEKVTLTLDSAHLEELRSLVGARSLSATVDAAVSAYLSRMRHLVAVDEWLAELEREHGPVPTETLEWAAQLVETWEAGGDGRRQEHAI